MVRLDFMGLLKELEEGTTHLDYLYYSNIALAPKHEGAETLGDFRSIAMINSSIKIISNVLAKRLRPVLQNVIGEQQYSFIAGRIS